MACSRVVAWAKKLGQQGGATSLAEDTARAVGGAAEEAPGGEAQQGGPALDGQVVSGAGVATVDLAGRSGTEGTRGIRRGGGPRAGGG